MAPSTSTSTPELARIGWIAGGLLVALAAAPAHASPLSELAESLEPGQWGELATEEIDAVLVANGASGIQIPYSEDIVWDPQTRQLFFIGGDHRNCRFCGDLCVGAFYFRRFLCCHDGSRITQSRSDFAGRIRHGDDQRPARHANESG